MKERRTVTIDMKTVIMMKVVQIAMIMMMMMMVMMTTKTEAMTVTMVVD